MDNQLLQRGMMAEAEVAIRLAIHLTSLPNAKPQVTVCLDRHHVESAGRIIFEPIPFLREQGWAQIQQTGKHLWLGNYKQDERHLTISAHSRGGDVMATVGTRRIRAECKKGYLDRRRGNPENKLIHEAIGQLMTIEDYEDGDVLIVAVPMGDGQQAKQSWARRRLMEKAGISIVLVGRDGSVDGVPILSS